MIITGIGSTTTTINDSIFTMWAESTTASTIATSTIWQRFVTTSFTGTGSSVYYQDYLREYEQRRNERAEANRQRANAAMRERVKKEREAKIRAGILLKSSLHPVQLAQLKRYGYFFVIGNKSGNRYRIRNGRSLNVDLMVKDKPTTRYCAHTVENIPNEDTMLLQKIYLETMEDEFLRIANVQH